MDAEKLVNGVSHRFNLVLKNAEGLTRSVSREGHSVYKIIVDDNLKRVKKSAAVKYVQDALDSGFEVISSAGDHLP